MIDAIGLPAEWQEPARRRKIDNGVEVFEHGSVGDCAVTFRRDTKPNPNVLKSEAAKFPVFDEREIMIIKTAGDKLNTYSEIITARTWKDGKWARYKPLYDKWKEGLEYGGTSILEWKKATIAQRAALVHQNILTVEQFAEVSEDKAQRLPFDIKALWEVARTEIAAATAAPDINGYIDEIVDLRKRLAALEAAPSEEPAKRRGRPKKEEKGSTNED